MRSFLRHVVRTVMLAPIALACGGQTDQNAGPCKLASAGTPVSCSGSTTAATWQATVSGDPSTCGFSTDGGSTDSTTCQTFCGTSFYGECTLSGSTVTCSQGCAVPGRPHASLAKTDAPDREGVGGFFARAAYFESASVDAFEILERDLRDHGAPKRLVRGARAARRDEIRHARMATTLASDHGHDVERPAAPTHTSRDLESIAIENAVEGCVNETVAAAVAIWQAERCAPSLRAHFEAVARDEARHAALARRVDAWILPLLDAVARARVEAARSAKWDELERADSVGEASLGLPSTIEARMLARALRHA